MALFFFIMCAEPRYTDIQDYRKCMDMPSWRKEEYLDEKVKESLKYLKEIGVEYVAVVPTWYQKDKNSTAIYATDKTASDSAVMYIITVAKGMGLKVILKPHIDVEDGTFRGNISPSDTEAWFENYRKIIYNYAVMSESLGVEILCVGTELKSLSSRKDWIEIINSIKEIYNGKLTYAANWDEYPSVNCWHILDFVGIDAYFPLAVSEDAGIEEYTENFELWLEQVDEF